MSNQETNNIGQYAKVGNILKNTDRINKDTTEQSSRPEELEFSETFQGNPVKRMLYSDFIKK